MPSFSRIRSEGFSFYFGGLGVETRSLDAAFVFATVRNRQQHDCCVGPMAVPPGSAAKAIAFAGSREVFLTCFMTR